MVGSSNSIAIMQPYLFPYIGYFQLINEVSDFIFYDDVNYIKKGWIHRNNILVNDSQYLFSARLIKPSQNKKIYETKLYKDHAWKENLLKTIRYSYHKSNNFDKAYDIVESVLLYDHDTISDLAKHSITSVCNYLDMDVAFHTSSEIFQDSVDLKLQHRLIDICKKMNTQNYINANGGKSLYTKEMFAEHDINIFFIDSGDINYKNPYLSIIDLMMNISKKDIQDLIRSYNLI